MEPGPGFHSSPLGNFNISVLENHGSGGGVYHQGHPMPTGYDPYAFPPPAPHAQGYHQNNGHMPHFNHDFVTGMENMGINAPPLPAGYGGPKMVCDLQTKSKID
jgi:hypothetical protein